MTEKKALRILDYIEHIIVAITLIESYVEGLDRGCLRNAKCARAWL